MQRHLTKPLSLALVASLMAACTEDSAPPTPTAQTTRGTESGNTQVQAQADPGARAARPIQPDLIAEPMPSSPSWLAPASTGLWIEFEDLAAWDALEIGLPGWLGDWNMASTEEWRERMDARGLRADDLRTEERLALAATFVEGGRPTWTSIVPVEEPSRVLQSLIRVPGQEAPTAAGPWIALTEGAVRSSEAADQPAFPEASNGATARLHFDLDAAREVGISPLEVLGSSSLWDAALAWFPTLVEDLESARVLDLELRQEELSWCLELTLDGCAYMGTSSTGQAPAPLTGCQEDAVTVTGALASTDLAWFAPFLDTWVTGLGLPAQASTAGTWSFRSSSTSASSGSRQVLQVTGPDPGGLAGHLQEQLRSWAEGAGHTTDELGPLHSDAGAFAQFDVIPHQGDDEGSQDLESSFGMPRLRARCAWTEEELLLTLGETSSLGEPLQGEGAYPSECTGSWVYAEIDLDAAGVRDAGPLCPTALGEGFPLQSGHLQLGARTNGLRRTFEVRWRPSR